MYGKMKSALDLRRLRYFLAIVDHGSLSSAARTLHIAQPALSHHMGQIEKSLGIKLLNRHRDGVTLTEAGNELLVHARDIVQRFLVAESALAKYCDPVEEPLRLRLAIISSIAATITPILLEEFSRSLPGVAVRITEAGTLESRELVEEGAVDLAISLAPIGKATPIAWERLYLVTHKNSSLAEGEISFSCLLDNALILPARENPLRELLEMEAQKHGRHLNVVHEIDGPSSRVNALNLAKGSTVLGATSTIELSREPELVIRPIASPELRRPLYMAARRGLPIQFTRRVVNALVHALGSLESLDFALRSHEPVIHCGK
jgi:LysR family transcriptional regulator, nitrogen assimilation regulatory protein